MVLKYFLLIFIISISFGQNKKNDIKLEKQILEIIKGFNGDVGIYVEDLKTGKTVEINSDSLFPTASMIKIPIMCRIFEKIENGELNYDSVLTYRDSLYYDSDDIVGSFKDSAKITLSKLIMLTITTSDNTASLWCQQMADSGSAINNFLVKNGFENTKVNSRTKGREEFRKIYGWGVTTPKEMATLVKNISNRKIVSDRASDEMYRMLSRIYWDGEALSQIPIKVNVASKQGAVNKSRSEVVLVDAPNHPYVFCVITKNQTDESWEKENEGYVIIRKISHLLWKNYEPNYKWEKAKGMEIFWK